MTDWSVSLNLMVAVSSLVRKPAGANSRKNREKKRLHCSKQTLILPASSVGST
jgi:hypothetical protein